MFCVTTKLFSVFYWNGCYCGEMQNAFCLFADGEIMG